MHELGIVFHIIRTVDGACRDAGVHRVSAVTLQLGEVSGVVPRYLTDAWAWAAAKNPLVAGAELKVEEIPALTFCEGCGQTYGTVEHGKVCPHCGSEKTYLLQGQEVMVKEVEAAEDELASGEGVAGAAAAGAAGGAAGVDGAGASAGVVETAAEDAAGVDVTVGSGGTGTFSADVGAPSVNAGGAGFDFASAAALGGTPGVVSAVPGEMQPDYVDPVDAAHPMLID